MSTSKIYSYLMDIQNKCFEFAQTHSQEAKKFSTQNTILNITNIIITSGVATLTTSFSSMDREEDNNPRTVVFIISAVLLYISAVLNSIQQFLNLEKLSEKNKISSVKFITLGNNIKRFLAIEELQNQDIVEYFKWVSATYEEIISSNTKNELNLELTPDIGNFVSKIQDHEEENILDMNFDNDGDNGNMNMEIDNHPKMSHLDTDKVKYEIDRFTMDSYLRK